jgi:signal transduction histidine kinase
MRLSSTFRHLSYHTKILLAIFFVVFLSVLILGILGFMTLRRWEKTARQVMAESYVKTATMTVEKVEETLRRREEEVFHRMGEVLQRRLQPGGLHEAIKEFESQSLLGGIMYVLDTEGSVVYPQARRSVIGGVEGTILDRLRREAIAVESAQGRIHRLLLKEDREAYSLSFARVAGRGTSTYLVGFKWDPGNFDSNALFWIRTLDAATEAEMIFLAITDQRGKIIYSPYPVQESRQVASAPFTDLFPGWRVTVYQRGPVTFEEMLRRQVLVTGALIGMLVLAIASGLLFIYRISRREVEVARLKADFLTHVSHDLKTPLSLIRMYAETLEMGRVAEGAKRQEYYRIITQESERLSQLIENFLDISRIQEGKRPFYLRACDVGPLLDQTLEAFRYQLDRLGFKLDVEIQPDMPEVGMDPDAFRQALANVIDNAVKYSRDRKLIRVEARVWDGELRVSVADQGIGIAPEELPRIFERFYRVTRGDEPSSPGTGLGLTLASHLVEAHGGRVGVESTPGEGSTVTLIFPLGPERGGAA